MRISFILLLPLLASTLFAQSWIRRFPANSPSPRSNQALAYDSLRNRTVLFGGSNGTTTYGDTWEWDGNNWLLQTPAVSPPPCSSHLMAFDSWRGKTVLVTPAGATWEWDGIAWTPRAQAIALGYARGMTFDSFRGRTVLLARGALTAQGQQAITLEWDGVSWITVSTAVGPYDHPQARSMTFDSARGRSQVYVTYLSWAFYPPGSGWQMWEWDGTAWTNANVTSIPYIVSHQIAFHAARATTIWAGGVDSSGPSSGYTPGTQEYSAATQQWTSLPTTALTRWRYGHSMVYDSQRQMMVLFGGFDATTLGLAPALMSDTWELDFAPIPAAAEPYGAGCGTPPLALQPQAASRPLLGVTFVCDVANAFPGIAAVAWGFDSQWRVGYLPTSLDFVGIEGCDLWTSAEADLASPCVFPGSSTEFHLSIPNQTNLVGLQVFLQAWSLRPGFNTLSVVMSNGVAVTIGDV